MTESGDRQSAADLLVGVRKQMVGDGFQEMEPATDRAVRGGVHDPIISQKYVRPRGVGTQEAWDLYDTLWIAGNAVDSIVEDLLSEGIEIKIKKDEQLAQQLNKQIETLGILDDFAEAIRFALVEGDGCVFLGIDESGTPKKKQGKQSSEEASKTASSPSQEVAPERVKGISYAHPFKGSAIQRMYRNGDPLSTQFGEWMKYEVQTETFDNDGNEIGRETKTVHASRVIHFQPFPLHDSSSDDYRGRSYYQSWYDVLQIVDTAQWSIAVLIKQLIFRVLRTDMAEFARQAAKEGLQPYEYMQALARQINSLTFFVLEKGDASKGISADTIEFPTMSAGASAIGIVSEYVWQLASGATRMPRTRLIGNEAGKMSGAEWDAKNYYAGIKSKQKRWVVPQIRRIVDLLLWASGHNPEEVEYDVECGDPTPKDALQDAQTKLVEAQTEAQYVDMRAKTADEVREEVLGKPSLARQLVPELGEQDKPEGQPGEEEPEEGEVPAGPEGTETGAPEPRARSE